MGCESWARVSGGYLEWVVTTHGHATPFPVDVIFIDLSSPLWALTRGEKETSRGKTWEAIFSQ